MNILFITYWGLHDGLTQATVIPHLELLATFDEVETIHYLSIERNGEARTLDLPKVIHHQLQTSQRNIFKVFERQRVSRKVNALHQSNPFDCVMARTSMAAHLCFSFCRKNEIPISIESLEPHARYMVEDGIWSKYGVKNALLRQSELLQLKHAEFLIPLTTKYMQLIQEKHNVPEDRLYLMPCCVDTSIFRFSEKDRVDVRRKLQIGEDKVVGIYTGKVGGIYLDHEAIELLKAARTFFGDKFHLIVLSPDRKGWRSRLTAAGFHEQTYHLDVVPLDEIPKYLSASDYAFSLHRPTASKMAISPIKNAEYIANGLPVVIPHRIGDDSIAIEENNLGVVFDPNQISEVDFNALRDLIAEGRDKLRYLSWAEKFRSFSIVKRTYRAILDRL